MPAEKPVVCSLKPRQPVPDLAIETLGGSTWRLAEQHPQHFTMIVSYRGLHCPICKTYLRELNRIANEFEQHGIAVFAMSSDSQERAQRAQSEWGLDNLTLGYGLLIEKAREWGLYISTSRGKTSVGVEEPDLFSEPGVFLIRPDNTLYAAMISTMPFARPHFKEILSGLEYIIAQDYPARGEA